MKDIAELYPETSIMSEKIDNVTKAYLKKVLKTMSVGLMWMFFNVIVGLAYEYAYIDGRATTGNIIFYIWFIISLTALVWWYVRLWSQKIEGS
jgi:hypothetical protein